MVLQEIHQPYTTARMKDEYTTYYAHFDSDSPVEARSFLRERLLITIEKKLQKQETVLVLDMGAGKQIFEQETALNSRFKKIKDKVTWITIDISSISENNMLALDTAYAVQANGAELPFATNHFDIVFSSMAIDFMPRTSFNEVKRVTKDDGEFLVNLHHPNLISLAQLSLPAVLRKLQSTRKNYQNKVRYKSRKIHKAKDKFDKAQIEFNDIQFVLNHFPAHAFHQIEDIVDFLSTIFENGQITVSEQENTTGRNGWYFAQVLLGLK
jgi:ubiquinone/menaquinone biosynthesis C-methylase UbiE